MDGLNLYVYVDNNPFKHIDSMENIKVFPLIESSFYEIDVLSPTERANHNNHLSIDLELNATQVTVYQYLE